MGWDGTEWDEMVSSVLCALVRPVHDELTFLFGIIRFVHTSARSSVHPLSDVCTTFMCPSLAGLDLPLGFARAGRGMLEPIAANSKLDLAC